LTDGLKRLDRSARRLQAVAVLLLFGLAGLGVLRGGDAVRPGPDGDSPSPQSLPSLGRDTPPNHTGVRFVDVDRALPPVRGKVRFGADEDRPGKTYVGTAFATAADAVWVTARHVVEGCRRTELRHAGRIVAVSGLAHDRAADLSLLFAPTGGAVTVAASTPLPLVDDSLEGFAMGFPGGNPATVHLGYLGRVAAETADPAPGARSRVRLSVAGMWQINRTGLFAQPELGGISGGPLFDRQGALLGIVVGGQPRRARAISLDPVNLTGLLTAAGEHTGARGAQRGWRHNGLAPENADAARRNLLGDGLLAQVVCHM